MEPQSLLDFDLGEGESSDDSDFRIEDHPEESDDYSINSDDENKSMSILVYVNKKIGWSVAKPAHRKASGKKYNITKLKL